MTHVIYYSENRSTLRRRKMIPGRKIKPHWMALHYLATGQGLLIWGGQKIARKYHTHTFKGHSHLSNSAVNVQQYTLYEFEYTYNIMFISNEA